MKFDKTIEAVLALLLIYQSVLYLIISFELVDPWVFPTSVLFLVSCGLGAVFGVFGGCRLVQRALQGEAIRPQTALLLVLTVSLLSIVQGSFGFQNLNWKKGNDYSTNITDIPKFSLAKDERLRSTSTFALWGFMDIPQAILKSDTDSIVLPMPVWLQKESSSKRLIRWVGEWLGALMKLWMMSVLKRCMKLVGWQDHPDALIYLFEWFHSLDLLVSLIFALLRQADAEILDLMSL